MRRRKPHAPEPDRLLDQLNKVEDDLQKWIGVSKKNADFFRRDPLGAMRAAGLDLEDDIMLELEIITKSIARKLK
ncbi:MAG TPA: hypothetical protein VLA83_13895 [Candidatus Binatia bacterium]|nr:hypothetical protein [Candidatus Binatia bacterium]